MPKPNTRQGSAARTSPRRTTINSNLVDLSGKGRVKVTARVIGPPQSRGRGTPQVDRRVSLNIVQTSPPSSTSVTAIRSSPVSQTFASYRADSEEESREIPSDSPPATNTGATEQLVRNRAIKNQDDSVTQEEMATGGENSESGDQTLSNSTMDNLLAYFREAIRNTQDEFRRELAALRGDVGATNNRNGSATFGFNSQPSASQSNSPSYATFNTGIKLKDWKISYNGEGSVSDFLFKLDTLVERSQCSHDHLMSNFHIFLTGKAETFYWDFIRQFRQATYPMLKTALSKEFGSRESDHEILLKLSTRKQLPKESYDDYHSLVVRWNLRLTNPLTDEALIEIMKKNVHADLKVMLFIASPTDLGNLRDLARKAEKVLLENRNANTTRQRQVNEVTAETPDSDIDETDPQVEALKANRTWVKGDYSRIKCWNCLQLGHSYTYCPEETRQVFCYKCGQRGVTTVKCAGPHTGNNRRSERTTGDARSSI